MFKFSSLSFSYFIAAISLLFFTGMYVFAWAPPASAPPAGNVSAPLNVGSVVQTKSGALWDDVGFGTIGGIFAQGGIQSNTEFCIGTSCITSWPGAGGNVILRGTQCHAIGKTTPCTLTLTCPIGESLKSLGWDIQAGTTGDPSENEKANVSYYALASIKDTDPCVGNNSCTQSYTGTNNNSDLWGVMVGLCSAGTPPSSALPTGWYGWCKEERITGGPSVGYYCYEPHNPFSCIDGDGNPATNNDRFCSSCPAGYEKVTIATSYTESGGVRDTIYTYFCYKQ